MFAQYMQINNHWNIIIMIDNEETVLLIYVLLCEG